MDTWQRPAINRLIHKLRLYCTTVHDPIACDVFHIAYHAEKTHRRLQEMRLDSGLFSPKDRS